MKTSCDSWYQRRNILLRHSRSIRYSSQGGANCPLHLRRCEDASVCYLVGYECFHGGMHRHRHTFHPQPYELLRHRLRRGGRPRLPAEQVRDLVMVDQHAQEAARRQPQIHIPPEEACLGLEPDVVSQLLILAGQELAEEALRELMALERREAQQSGQLRILPNLVQHLHCQLPRVSCGSRSGARTVSGRWSKSMELQKFSSTAQ
jgi:hypothetical protein